jgi:hypothetical protein
MASGEGRVDGSEFPEIDEMVSEMTATYHRRREAGRKLAEIIAATRQDVLVDFATYFAVINQRSLEEAEGERLRKVGYYNEIFSGLNPDDVGEPVLITNHTMVREMGVVGSFSEQPQPVRYTVGAASNGDRWGKIELAFKRLQMPHEETGEAMILEEVEPLAIADEISYQHVDGENIVTDIVFRTKLYIGRQGVQNWVDIKFPGVGDGHVAPLLKALENGSTFAR